ncbi:DUF551 domain-containing protein [Enterobacter kobei]|uniref:DUF551 domain-containing protein n=1 Tax=Enterobacter kobei TaxID=208224 RepID=UPI00388E4E66
MSTITKERLEQLANFRGAPVTRQEEQELARIALASLEAEGGLSNLVASQESLGGDFEKVLAENIEELYVPGISVPPAPVSVPDCFRNAVSALESLYRNGQKQNWNERYTTDMAYASGVLRACRASMYHGVDTEFQRKAAIHDALCEKYNVESLADFVNWQRNHIAELEAAPPAPVGPGEAAVMPDYPGYTMTQRECFQAGKKAGMAEPVTTANKLPDGWVACSERMPEDDDFVFIWPRPDFGVELHVAQYGKFDKRDAGWYAQVYEQNYGIEYYPVKVTHWMPLPAAPQQEA